MKEDKGASPDGDRAGRASPEPCGLGHTATIPSAWQPIETAPKREAAIIAWDGFSVFKAYWCGDYGTTYETHSPRPWITHWMPLPAPPEGE
jgi:hypothetical protein